MNACTIVARNYLAQARTLAASFLEHHPEGRFSVLVIDGPYDGFLRPDDAFETLDPTEIGLAEGELERMRTLYDVIEFATAAKPFLLRTLLARDGGSITYLDPDILIFSRLDEIDELARGTGIVLTPHTTEPMLRDGLHPTEQGIMQAGIYNLGFVSVGEAGVPFLDWWCERLARDCIVAVESGLFVDQKWVDFVPGYWDCAILRDAGYNVAYWNLPHRAVESSGDGYLVNGRPLRFFHYSGYSPKRPRYLSKFQGEVPRVRLDDHAELRELCELYAERLAASGFGEATSITYAAGRMANGLELDRHMRAAYRHALLYAERTGEPEPPAAFGADGGEAFVEWLREPVDGGELSRYLLTVHRSHPALRGRYAQVPGVDTPSFLQWVGVQGAAACGIPDALQPGVTGAVRPPELPAELRSRVTLAFAEELMANPELLRRYSRAVAAADDATLAIVATDEAVAEPLMAILGELGLDGSDAPDMLLLAGHQDAAQLAARAAAVLCDLDPDAAYAGLPRFGAAAEHGVNLLGFFKAELGVGEAGRHVVAAVEQAGIPHVTLTTDIAAASRNGHAFDERGGVFRYDTTIACVNADALPRVLGRHGRDLIEGRHTIGVWWWELSRFPTSMHDAFDLVDEVWAGSRFVADAIAAETSLPVHAFPLPVAPPPATQLRRAGLGIPERFMFLCTFDFHSIYRRKNPGAVVQAFTRAFGHCEGPVLVVKSLNGRQHPAELAELRALAAGRSDVIMLEDYLSAEDKNGLIAGADCYVSLHRSEGFGLGLAEAMYYGVPAIGTGYSGNTSFMDEANSLLVPYEIVPVGPGAAPYDPSAEWAEPDIDAAAALMRRLAGDPDAARALGLRGQESIRRTHSLDAAARFVEARLAAIRGTQGLASAA